jgi:hypothetical protein
MFARLLLLHFAIFLSIVSSGQILSRITNSAAKIHQENNEKGDPIISTVNGEARSCQRLN